MLKKHSLGPKTRRCRGGGGQDGTNNGLGKVLSQLFPSQSEPADVDTLLKNISGAGADFPGCKFPK